VSALKENGYKIISQKEQSEWYAVKASL